MESTVAMAGGVTLRGQPKSGAVLRGEDLERPEVKILDLKAALRGEGGENVFLTRGDIVYVPTSFITKVDDVFRHLSTIVNPVVELERGIIRKNPARLC